MHYYPDGAACIPHGDRGWIYLSASDTKIDIFDNGGVGAFRFDRGGYLTYYKMVLKGTKQNSGGGVTPWGTFLSGEGNIDGNDGGQLWEVDPTGTNKANVTAFQGSDGSSRNFESAACDDRDIHRLECFATIDSGNGELRWFKPNATVLEDAIANKDYSKVLIGDGNLDYLLMTPDTNSTTVDTTTTTTTTGTIAWTDDVESAKDNAKDYYGGLDGIAF